MAEQPIGQEFEVPGSEGKLFKTILTAGSGELPPVGSRLSVHYVGTLTSNGQQFDSSRAKNRLFQFVLGVGQVIKGWDVGMGTMKKGEKSILRIHPDWGYGARGAGGVIPPNAELRFEVEVFDFTKP